MEKIDSFIFDLDGTLLDTVSDIKEAVNYSLIKHHLKERTLDEIISFIGHGSKHLIQEAIAGNDSLFDSVFETYYKYYENHFNVFTKPYDGIIESVEHAKSCGIRLYIYTNKPYEMTESLVKYHFKKDLFSKVVSIKKTDRTFKPDPSLFLKEVEKENISFEDSFYFGDSEVDIMTAKNLNIENMVSVTYGYKTREFLENFSIKPKYLIDDAREIKDIVDRVYN